ncbi:trypsin alpha-like [Bradysia coprophila]|uniref:trypsin alpha-like n=1 Tax=Bradysia coprophila TaxID=38358 RepID=UPI00187DC0B5|nr:trypsin alpha-like [Bradysia coprophila]
MKLIIVFATVVAGAFAVGPLSTGQNGMQEVRQGRIVGGSAVSISSFPWAVSLRSWGAHRCGAAIITPTRILTAAHCTIGGSNTGFEVRAGSTQRESGGQLVASERVINHPRFSLSTIENDICVIWLSSALTLNPAAVAVIPLHDDGFDLRAGTMVTVAGWGALCEYEGCEEAPSLRAVTLPVVSNALCNAHYGGGVTAGMLCAGFADGGRDSCQGDSGGPLSMGNVLVGVVSRGRGCGRPNQPGIYARVAYYRKWIVETI